MKMIAVDDERLALRSLAKAVREAVPDDELICFSSPMDALDHLEDHDVDVAFLDIEMNGISGINLAWMMKEVKPEINIIFVTAYSEYAPDAFTMRASGYVLKPVDPRRITEELENLRYPVNSDEDTRVRICCFGGFEVFVDGKLLTFSRSKSKELLAYLIHKNGLSVTAASIASVLWEDKAYNRSVQTQTQTVISQLMRTLKDAGIRDVILKGWNSLAIDVTKISCDYYDFLRGDVSAINAYHGEYLTEYSWAEMMLGNLDREKSKHNQ